MDKYTQKIYEDEIIQYINGNKKVYIESGCLNDEITGYREEKNKKSSWRNYEEIDYIFKTSACVFPKEIKLSNYDNCDTEEYNNCLFVQVW